MYQYLFNLLMGNRLFSVFLYKYFKNNYTFPRFFFFFPPVCSLSTLLVCMGLSCSKLRNLPFVLYFGTYWNPLSSSDKDLSRITYLQPQGPFKVDSL